MISKRDIMRAKPEKTIVTHEKPTRTIFQEYAEAFVVAVILAIIIRAVFVQAFKIPSSSMEPTLLVGDHILVNKFIYGLRIPFTTERWPKLKDPKRGDVIVFIYPEDRTKDFIKRVVAVGGETIEIQNKKVLINGKEPPEHYGHFFSNVMLPGDMNPRDNMPPVKVPDGTVFVMGDNRDFSHDSRFWGFVPIEDIKGEAFIIYYSGKDFEQVRWNRFLKIIR